MQSSAPIKSLITLIGGTYLILGYGLFLSVADNYLGKAQILPVAPTIAAILFLLPIFGIILIRETSTTPPLVRLISIYRDNWLIVVPFACIAFFSLTGAMHPTAYWREQGKWIYLNSYNFMLLCLAMALPLIYFIRKNFHWLTFTALSALIGSIIADIVTPGTFSVELNRAAGFPANSNWGALAVVMLAAGTLRYDFFKHRVFDGVVLLMSALAVFSTLSRSGTVNLSILFFYYFITIFTRQKLNARAAVLSLAGLASLILLISAALPWLMENTQLFSQSNSKNRLLGFFEGKVVDDGSSSGRLGAAEQAIELIEDSPIIGHGTGFSRTMPEKPHNLYLNQWVNNGLPGLVSYAGLLLGSLWLFRRRDCPQGIALILVTIIGSGFSHNILEQRSFLIQLASLGTISLIDLRSRNE